MKRTNREKKNRSHFIHFWTECVLKLNGLELKWNETSQTNRQTRAIKQTHHFWNETKNEERKEIDFWWSVDITDVTKWQFDYIYCYSLNIYMYWRWRFFVFIPATFHFIANQCAKKTNDTVLYGKWMHFGTKQRREKKPS